VADGLKLIVSVGHVMKMFQLSSKEWLRDNMRVCSTRVQVRSYHVTLETLRVIMDEQGRAQRRETRLNTNWSITYLAMNDGLKAEAREREGIWQQRVTIRR
jgi:hypothetical protein